MGLFYEMDKNFGDVLKEKKNFLFIGEAGSGKSEIVLNVAAKLARETGKKVDLFDMDQTKPLYRSRDMADDFKENFSFFYKFADFFIPLDDLSFCHIYAGFWHNYF